MDTVTHLLVGAATPLVFKRSPRGAAVVAFGIICGELPDIDVLGGASAKAMLLVHRGVTHSFPFIIAASLLLALAFRFFLQREGPRPAYAALPSDFAPGLNGAQAAGSFASWDFKSLWLAALLGICLHVYLDCMTTFGTRIFWPISDYRVALPAMFIVDPLFTLPLLAMAVILLTRLRRPGKRLQQVKLARVALAWAIIYPLLSLGLSTALKTSLNEHYSGGENGISHISITPEPFAPFLWRVVGENDSSYRLALFSLFSPRQPLEFSQAYTKPEEPLWRELQQTEPLLKAHAAFASFLTQTQCALPENCREIIYTDLRYVSTLERLFKLLGRDDGNFIMQVKLDNSNKLLAWRYLSRGKDEAVEPWRPPTLQSVR